MSDASNEQDRKLAEGTPEDGVSTSAKAPTPGAQLCIRRQELNWSVEHVASRLNLAARQIEAIEADNHAALPGIASTRGFIRAYAKLLNLEPAPLVSALAIETSPRDDGIPLRRPLPAAPFFQGRLTPMKRGGSFRQLVLIAGVLLLVVFAVMAYRSGWLAPLSDRLGLRFEAVASKESSDPPSGASTLIPAPAALIEPPLVGAVVPQLPLPVETARIAMSTPTPPAVSVDVTAPPDKPSPVIAPVLATPQDRPLLVLKANEDCWIDIRKPDNTPVLSRTIQAGSTERIDLDGPVTVVFGNAVGIEAILRGRPLDVRAYAKNNVARLDLK